MKITDLKSELSKLHIPNDSYSIDDIEDESLCLILDEGVWCVFYSERGNRAEAEYFANKNDACGAFLARIKKWF